MSLKSFFMTDHRMPEHEMLVVAFDNENDADQVLDSLKGMESMDILDLKNAAVIVRDSSGEVKIKETSDFDTKQGAMGGAAAGGAAAGKFIDLGLDDDFLKEIGDTLGPGTSAVVALVDFEQVDQAMEELDKFEGGRILRYTLSDDVYVKLSEAVED